MSILEELEEKLGRNLVLLGDKVDLLVRQRDPETEQALQDITDAWEVLVLLVAMERSAKKRKLRFETPQDGDSVVDSLFHSATECFPNAVASIARQQKEKAQP